VRLHELAKELEADSRRLLSIAKELGLGVKSHSSNLPTGTAGILKAAWQEELEEQAAAAKKAAKKADEEAKAKEQEEEAASESDLTVSVTVKSQATVEAEQAAAEPEPVEAEAEETPEARASTTETETETVEDTTEEAAPEPVEAAPVPVEAAPEPVEAETEAVEAETEAVEAEAVAEAPAEAPVAEVEETVAAEAPPEPSAEEPAPSEGDDDEDEEEGVEKTVVVTFGGEPQVDDEPEGQSAEGGAEAGARSKDGEVRPIGVPNVPVSRERKGAKILGKIDLTPADTSRQRSQPAFDPLDPTRAIPGRRGGSPGKRDSDQRAKQGRPGKSGDGEFVFDPEDNTALSAIRLGHFANRRRPPPRRPPMRRSRMGGARRAKKLAPRPTHPVSVRPPIGVRDLSEELGIKAREILMHLQRAFDPRDKNAVLEADHLVELAVALDREITILEPESAEGRLVDHEEERAKGMAKSDQPRAPVVAVMGHVDHGKTTLLDALRRTRVAAKEAGGITQRTSAYAVPSKSGGSVTFIDTPGHKAFTEMRARGASVTDVAVLVVAADDGVMDQTMEAIDHAKAAGVPLVVAINKVDKNNADPMKVRQQLASAEVLVEDYGGDIGVVECSAVEGKGLDALVERLALETEILELSADPGVPARGVVIDSRKDSKLGIVATVIVQRGTLRAKEPIIAGTSVGRVRWLLDDRGKRVKEAGPSTPVEVVGFEDPPQAGSRLMAVDEVNMARDVAAERKEAEKDVREAAVDSVTLDTLFDTIEAQQVTEINVLLKADSTGALDVLKQSVQEITHDEVRFKILRSAVGGITEDDVVLASASDAFIIGFGVVADAPARAAVQRTGVDVKYYDVIYEMTEDLEKALEGELGTESHEEVTGHAVIRQIFRASRHGNIAGCYVTDGTIHRDSRVRLVRDGKVVHTGRLDSLRRFKDDVKEVRENYECGMHLDGFNDIKEEDVIEAFKVIEVKRTLESTSR